LSKKKAKLVVIALVVIPIELVVWLPALCRKMDIPYLIIKGKSRLGKIVHRKTATALALTGVKDEDLDKLQNLATVARELFNDNAEIRKHWGGGKLGAKSIARRLKKQKLSVTELKPAKKE